MPEFPPYPAFVQTWANVAHRGVKKGKLNAASLTHLSTTFWAPFSIPTKHDSKTQAKKFLFPS
jgi:hypothetical protein